jgi:CHAT domain-containing protein
LLCQLDRAETYLGLNLFIDARNTAEDAEMIAQKLNITYETAKAAFFAGKASIGLGNAADARAFLERAELGFSKEKNHGFLAVVRLAKAELEKSDKKRKLKVLKARSNFKDGQLPLWEAISDLQILSRWPDEYNINKRIDKNLAAKTVPHLLVQNYTLKGDRAASVNRMDEAIKHWTNAADILDSVRAKLPPMEMRSSFFKSRNVPHRRLIDSYSDEDPTQAAIWSERYKTTGLWSTTDELIINNPVRCRTQKSLAELAKQISAVSGMIAVKGGQRSAVTNANVAVMTRLHQNVRHDLSILEKSVESRYSHNELLRKQIKKVSENQPLVQFHLGDRDILAFVHYNGQTGCYRYTDGVGVLDELLGRWKYLVESTPGVKNKSLKHRLNDEDKILSQLGNWILQPLEIPDKAKKIIIIPEGQLTRLPWMALRLNSETLVDRTRVVISPSIQHYIFASKQATTSKEKHLFVGNIDNLPYANREIQVVASKFGTRNVTVHSPCYRADWPDIGAAKVWHFTGHANLRIDNPFYSSLMLADGPLFAADFRLKRNRVDLITLAACRTGQQTNLPGEESSGLVRALLEMGARSVLAGNWAVSDQSTSEWMELFYTNYFKGKSVTKAVQNTSCAIRERYPSAYHWGAFSVFGAG